jgi:hypothetical protein
MKTAAGDRTSTIRGVVPNITQSSAAAKATEKFKVTNKSALTGEQPYAFSLPFSVQRKKESIRIYARARLLVSFE